MAVLTYMLHDNGGAFYAGHTDNLERRVARNEQRMLPGFTRERLPVCLVWSETFGTRKEALATKRHVKGWSRAKKMALVRGDWESVQRLSRRKKEGLGFDRLSPNGVGASQDPDRLGEPPSDIVQ